MTIRTGMIFVIRMLAYTCPFWAWGTLSQADRSGRTTPVVLAVKQAKNAVVNISTTRVIKARQFFGMGRDIFDFFSWPRPSVRQVEVYSLGSGFIIHRSGYIVTNAHVVTRAEKIIVSLADGRQLPARIVGGDPECDLAILKVDTQADKPLEAIKLGTAKDLMIGETVIAIGNPRGYQHTVTVGVISAVGRTLQFEDDLEFKDLIQTDAAINPGSSGGPLLNIDGQLIGINTAIRGDAQNIGFAISVDRLKSNLPRLLNAQLSRRLDLGMTFLPGPQEQAVRVVSVEIGSPANLAGLQAGDLITGLDGNQFTRSTDFYIELLERPIGRPLVLAINRQGKVVNLSMPFKQKPRPDGAALARSKLGLVLKLLTPGQLRRLGLAARSALIVEAILPGGPADQAGITTGDIIYQLDDSLAADLDQIGQILENIQSGRPILVHLVRIKGNSYFHASTHVTVR